MAEKSILAKKIKLPRKRKKAFKNSKPQGEYMMVQVLAELLTEEGRKYAGRFYDLQIRKRGDKRFSPFGNEYIVVKRW